MSCPVLFYLACGQKFLERLTSSLELSDQNEAASDETMFS